MKLAQPFYRLPVRFDAQRLRAEVEALPAGAWATHPGKLEGNSAVRLVSADGGENDEVYGLMQPTPHLARCPYIRQVLASFGVVWSRSRLMKLDARSTVPDHADINYHWFYRVRMHIPVVTRPEVRFHCGGQAVHMAAGEAWIFDNWRRHRVENPTDDTRIHLVADTSGTAEFWRFVAQAGAGQLAETAFSYRPGVEAGVLTERSLPRPVMPPAELELLVADLRGELVLRDAHAGETARLARYHALLQSFCFDWRQRYALRGEDPAGRQEYAEMREQLRDSSKAIADGIAMRSNDVDAHLVLEGRVIQHLLPAANIARGTAQAGMRSGTRAAVREPLFIVAAPRSGSTLLFETLRASGELWSLGDEAHWLVEGIPELRPGAGGADSNRLTGADCTPAIAERIRQALVENLRDANGGGPPAAAGGVRVLEKTPKNALRIPFFTRIFPDARFILLWRDPRENLGSIIEAWRSGKWTTYPSLPGWDGPWSMLLPPGWQALRGRPLEEIAAWQWDSANRTMLDDLAALPRDRWTSLSYAAFLADPGATVRRLCEFAGVAFDAALAARVAGPLPFSRYTQTPPEPDKWRRNEAAILRVIPGVEATWRRLQAL